VEPGAEFFSPGAGDVFGGEESGDFADLGFDLGWGGHGGGRGAAWKVKGERWKVKGGR
jgi:hypothetical protein